MTVIPSWVPFELPSSISSTFCQTLYRHCSTGTRLNSCVKRPNKTNNFKNHTNKKKNLNNFKWIWEPFVKYRPFLEIIYMMKGHCLAIQLNKTNPTDMNDVQTPHIRRFKLFDQWCIRQLSIVCNGRGNANG